MRYLRRTFRCRALLPFIAIIAGGCGRQQVGSAPPPLGRLAYVDRGTLWIRDLPDGVPQAIATGRRIASPEFSPSGQWLSFRDTGQVRVVSVAGRSGAGKPGKEWKGGFSQWLPGSDELAVYAQEENAGQSWVFTPANGWNSPLRYMAGDGLTLDPAGRQYARTDRRPDGRYPDGVLKYRTTLLVGQFGNSAALKRPDTTEGFFDIAGFTQSGAWLVYWRAPEMSASLRADGLDLYAANVATGEASRLGVGSLVYNDFISFAPTRDAIAVASGDGRETWTHKAIVVVEFTAGGKPMIKTITDSLVSAQFPAWSPDGAKLAWSGGPDAGAGGEEQAVRSRRIRIAGAPVTNDPNYFDEAPRWSRDGSRIVFSRIDRNNAKTIWMMRADGSDLRQIAGPLRPPDDLSELERLSYSGYYGYTDWRGLFDWWRG